MTTTLETLFEILNEYNLSDVLDNPIDIHEAIEQLEDYLYDCGTETCSYDVETINILVDVINNTKGA